MFICYWMCFCIYQISRSLFLVCAFDGALVGKIFGLGPQVQCQRVTRYNVLIGSSVLIYWPYIDL